MCMMDVHFMMSSVCVIQCSVMYISVVYDDYKVL